MTAAPTPSRAHLTLALIKAALGIGGLLLVVVLVVIAVVGGHDKAGTAKADGGAYLACSKAVSVLDDASVERLRERIWQLTGLMRVYLRDGEHPIALHPPATVLDVADAIHHDLGVRCTGARVWGPSARFDGQQVGRAHVLLDGDTVEILD